MFALAHARVDGPHEAARGHDARARAPDAGPVGDDAAAELRAVRAAAVRLRGRELRGWRRGWRLRGEG